MRAPHLWYWVAFGMFLLLVATGWLGVRAIQAGVALTSAAQQVASLQSQLLAGEEVAARRSLADLQQTTQQARVATTDPVWSLAAHLPWLGRNLSAVTTVAVGIDDVADLALPPVLETSGAMSISQLAPVDGRIDLAPLVAAEPFLVRAADAAAAVDAEVAAVSTDGLLGVVAGPVARAQAELHELASTLRTGQRAATLLPPMLGADGPRSYLLLLQTNAELRATGGMPGALSIITADDGFIEMAEQSTAAEVHQGGLSDLTLAAEDESLYSSRMGTYMADVNFTPDFPTAAQLARDMWSAYSGRHVDGVLATDPVALSYLLRATGPVDDGSGGRVTADNAVDLLLSEAYVRFPDTSDQNDYFAAVAANAFTSLVGGAARPAATVPALAQAAGEHRLLVWSAAPEEQAQLSGTVLAGAMPTEPAGTSAVGVFFNDGTGSKMDYHLDTTVELVDARCEESAASYVVRVSLTNTAPADAATSLGASVTGPGTYGAQRGDIETSVVLIGPVGGTPLGVLDGKRPFGTAAHTQDGRPASIYSVVLAPGETAVRDVMMTDPSPGDVLELWSTPTKDKPGLSTVQTCGAR